ncbi:MAG: hypothetical protein JW726_16340 [Anaerolineales bacterium]|nr:hypothetical protein [Anaerolineales bacterium]
MKGKPRSLLLFGALPFFRPELALLTVLALGYAWLARRASWKVLGTVLLGAAPFVLYNLLFFGGLLPNTVQAKSAVYEIGMADALAQYIARIIDDVLIFKHMYSFPFAHQLGYAFFMLVLISGSVAVYLYRQLRLLGKRAGGDLDAEGLLFALWGMGTLGAYVAARVKLFTWYEPLYIIPGLLVVCKALLFSQLLGLLEIALALYERFQLPVLNEEDTRISGIREVWGSEALNIFLRKDYLAQEAAGCPELGIVP